MSILLWLEKEPRDEAHTKRSLGAWGYCPRFCAREDHLCLMSFDGKNPHSVVVLDNCSIHDIPGIVEMIQEVGALVHFLPPYSPDYSPIEEAFSKVKSNLKTMDMEANVFEDPENLVLTTFSSITSADCQKWINHAGIYIK